MRVYISSRRSRKVCWHIKFLLSLDYFSTFSRYTKENTIKNEHNSPKL